MKKTAKTLATILLASSAAKALEAPLIVSGNDLKAFGEQKNILNLKQRLLQHGLLVQTNKKDVFIFNDAALSKLSDDKSISVMSDLIKWLTDDSIQIEEKNWKEMTASTQDYKV